MPRLPVSRPPIVAAVGVQPAAPPPPPPLSGLIAGAPTADEILQPRSSDSRPGWWREAAAMSRAGLVGRIVELTVSDATVMPLQVGHDVGEIPEVDGPLSEMIVARMASPFENRRGTWARYCRLMVTLGEALWVRVDAETVGAEYAGLFPGGQSGWVVASPLDAERERGSGNMKVVVAGGHQLVVPDTAVVRAVWSDPLHAAERVSLVRRLIPMAATLDRAETAMWARLDTTAQAGKFVDLPAGYGPPEVRRSDPQAQPDQPGRESVAAVTGRQLTARVVHTITDRRDPKSRVPMVMQRAGQESATVHDLAVNMDPALVAAIEKIEAQLAVAASVPTHELTGEQPKFANMFASRAQFVRSPLAALAFDLCSALGGVLFRELADLGKQDPTLIFLLDPSPLIEEAQEDAQAARGTMAAGPAARQVVAAPTVAEVVPRSQVARLNAWQRRSVRSLQQAAKQAAKARGQNPEGGGEWWTGELLARLASVLADLRSTRGGRVPVTDEDVARARRALTAAGSEADRVFASGGTAERATRLLVPTLAGALLGSSSGLFGRADGVALLDRTEVSTVWPELRADTPGEVVWRWNYGDASTRPSGSWEPHEELDGMVADEGGPGTWDGEEPDGSPAEVGGHAGCQCVLDLVEVTEEV